MLVEKKEEQLQPSDGAPGNVNVGGFQKISLIADLSFWPVLSFKSTVKHILSYLTRTLSLTCVSLTLTCYQNPAFGQLFISRSSFQRCQLSLVVPCPSAGSNSVNSCRVSPASMLLPLNAGVCNRFLPSPSLPVLSLFLYVIALFFFGFFFKPFFTMSAILQVSDFIESLPGCENQAKQFQDEVRHPPTWRLYNMTTLLRWYEQLLVSCYLSANRRASLPPTDAKGHY